MALLRLPFLARFALPCWRCRLLASLACLLPLLASLACLAWLFAALLGCLGCLCSGGRPRLLAVAAWFDRRHLLLAMADSIGRLPRRLPCRLLRASSSGACHAACFGCLPQLLGMAPASAVFLSCLAWPQLWPSSSVAWHGPSFGRLPQVIAMPPALASSSGACHACLLWPSCSVTWHGPCFGRLLYCCKVHALPSCLPFGPDCLLRPPPFWLARTGASILICWLWTSCATGSLLIRGTGRVDQGRLLVRGSGLSRRGRGGSRGRRGRVGRPGR
ncbi:hypothetical protein LMG1873_05244 [Achromobacter piechaudii]|uniref:Uncharacterized protein n=1 Tax=Achromobacter piechaudii TaxID=72556 RepID=A0ABN7F6C0_9BURK|nr:hypothetical protein LMG1873_05244 [Achromobacter piechaudii]CAB3917102.1 hypothetical protein LMG2828_05333 [Achromobacter piechaudii]CAB3955599.1 hypothetical protein LMG6103_04557 [Achromobacter piechaudii]